MSQSLVVVVAYLTLLREFLNHVVLYDFQILINRLSGSAECVSFGMLQK